MAMPSNLRADAGRVIGNIKAVLYKMRVLATAEAIKSVEAEDQRQGGRLDAVLNEMGSIDGEDVQGFIRRADEAGTTGAAEKVIERESEALRGAWNHLAGSLLDRSSRVEEAATDEFVETPASEETRKLGTTLTAVSGLVFLVSALPEESPSFSGFGVELALGPGMVVVVVLGLAYLLARMWLARGSDVHRRRIRRAEIVRLADAPTEAIRLLACIEPLMEPTLQGHSSGWRAHAEGVVAVHRGDIWRGRMKAHLQRDLPFYLGIAAVLAILIRAAVGFPATDNVGEGQPTSIHVDRLDSIAASLETLAANTAAAVERDGDAGLSKPGSVGGTAAPTSPSDGTNLGASDKTGGRSVE